jgi:MFS family permease
VSVFKNVPVAAILLQNFFFGMIFYGYIYYLPLYFQNVRRFEPLKSAYMTIPLVVTQSIASITSGQYISRMKRYGECIFMGFVLLTISTSLIAGLFNRTIPIYAMVLILVTQGIGNGNVFQPTIIALQAHSPKSQRAIVISIRNFLRCLGGSIGLAVNAAILQNELRSSLPPQFQHLARSSYTKPDYSQYNAADTEVILNAYEKASHSVFIFLAPVAGCCLLTCAFVRDRGLKRAEEVQEEKAKLAAELLEREGKLDTEKAMMASEMSLPFTGSEHEKEKESDIVVEVSRSLKPMVAPAS